MKIGRLVLRSSLIMVLGLGIWIPSAAGQQKIGYVSVSHVFESTNEGKAILKRLKSEHMTKQKELDQRMKAFQEKAKQFQQQSAMLKDDVRKERIQVLSKEEQQLQALFMQYQNDINKKKSDALGKFEQKVMGIVQIVAKREGLDYILRQEVLLFGPDKMDMTNQVIREYDKRHSAKSGKKKGK
jgi:Skp family chaperone for outer membrane proteins